LVVKNQKRALKPGRIYNLVPNRLSFTVHTDEDMTLRYINKYKQRFFFSTTHQTHYAPFCLDFGPVDLSVVHEFCQVVKSFWDNDDLRDAELVYYLADDMAARTNGAFLLAAFMMIELKYTPEAAWLPFTQVNEDAFSTFRDATFCQPQSYHLGIKACLEGLYKGMNHGFYDPASFQIEEYLYLSDPNNADMNVVCPKFVAFRGPTRKSKEIHPGVCTFTPRHYRDVFKQAGVTAVVRLNEAHTYDPEQFERDGFRHYDLYFDDCTVPDHATIERFLSLAEREKGSVAVHCTAGLGRTGTLIAIYLMKHYGWTASECIGWLRIVRPGSVIGPQQQFLHQAEAVYRKATRHSSTTQHPPQIASQQSPLSTDNSLHLDALFPSSGPDMDALWETNVKDLQAAATMGRRVATAQMARAQVHAQVCGARAPCCEGKMLDKLKGKSINTTAKCAGRR
jgi:protein-tyrosine phosphatase